MRRIVLAAVLLPTIALVIRKVATKAAPAIRAKCSATCERMLANMPESFPPNRILTDIEALRDENARILKLMERQTADYV